MTSIRSVSSFIIAGALCMGALSGAHAASSSTGILEFTTNSAASVQSSGSISMAVGRIAGSSGPASVNYSTINGTAIAGTDYRPRNGTLTWADGDTAPKTITLTVYTATSILGHEELPGRPVGPVRRLLGSPAKITATIIGATGAPATAPPAPPVVTPPVVTPPVVTSAPPIASPAPPVLRWPVPRTSRAMPSMPSLSAIIW